MCFFDGENIYDFVTIIYIKILDNHYITYLLFAKHDKILRIGHDVMMEGKRRDKERDISFQYRLILLHLYKHYFADFRPKLRRYIFYS